MTRYYYTKGAKKNIKKIIRFIGLSMTVAGLCLVLYIFTPYVLYQLTFASGFAAQNIVSPVPHTTLVDGTTLPDSNSLDDDYINAQRWFPTYSAIRTKTKVSSYFLTIPKLSITNATVSTIDDNLALHLINYAGTAVPPDHGTAVAFGHSTLPSLYNQKDYKTILANIYKLSLGDEFLVDVENKTYTYQIYAMTVINPDDTSMFQQNYDDSYLFLVTCVPPGTLEKRLVIKSRLKI